MLRRAHIGSVLIELMISLVISLSLLAILYSFYQASYRAYQIQTDWQSMTERAQAAIHFLTTDIKQAGFIGCRQVSQDFIAQSLTPYANNLTINNRLVGRNDHIQLRHLSQLNTNVVKAESQRLLFLNEDIHLSPGEIGLISDCMYAEQFQVEQVLYYQKHPIIILKQPLKHIYSRAAMVGKLEINEYFIDEKQHALILLRRNDDMKIIQKIALVPDIDQMRIKYSIIQHQQLLDESSDYITDWSRVVGVLIQLTVNVHRVKKNWLIYVALN